MQKPKTSNSGWVCPITMSFYGVVWLQIGIVLGGNSH